MFFRRLKMQRLILFIFVIVSFVLAGCTAGTGFETSAANHNKNYSEKELLVHYIDVGQGDSILVQINNKNLLIDAGPRESADKVINYLSSQGVKKLDYVVATHPHEDHIGGMDDVIKKFNIGEFYAPKKTATTKTFEEMVTQLKNKKLKINVAKAGLNLDLGTGITCSMLAPNSTEYEEINNYSAVIKITYNNTKFIFTGDAEKLSEKEMLHGNFDLSADVIKIAHHGSNSSSSKEFLSAVNPKFAVISVGKGNDYGHPHSVTLTELKSRNITTYRTDKDGDILFLSDGKNIIKK